ncbi:MAG: tRNA pseudouridine(55) synthase TruB [Chloroflexota bacterium]|nr:tRNA pseudouridine(55) synthase TruB [Chloroflexota bacterium]
MSAAEKAKTAINGILNINKPPCKTSQDIVAIIRRLSGQRQVGHAGTLDPMATGVLPVCLGQATRMSSYIMEFPKTYIAEITLGISTDTYDAEGTITHEYDPYHINRVQIEELIPSLTGRIMQKPPAYSALKRRGRRLYELARAGIEVEIDEREVEVHRLELLDWQPPCFIIEVECGKGTYIRSLAHDIGQSVACGAHISSLVRTTYGPFSIEESLTLPQLEDSFRNGYWQELLYPMDFAIQDWAVAIIDGEHKQAVLNGRPVQLHIDSDANRCRAYSPEGELIALLRIDLDTGLWQPDKVFHIKIK